MHLLRCEICRRHNISCHIEGVRRIEEGRWVWINRRVRCDFSAAFDGCDEMLQWSVDIVSVVRKIHWLLVEDLLLNFRSMNKWMRPQRARIMECHTFMVWWRSLEAVLAKPFLYRPPLWSLTFDYGFSITSFCTLCSTVRPFIAYRANPGISGRKLIDLFDPRSPSNAAYRAITSQ